MCLCSLPRSQPITQARRNSTSLSKEAASVNSSLLLSSLPPRLWPLVWGQIAPVAICALAVPSQACQPQASPQALGQNVYWAQGLWTHFHFRTSSRKTGGRKSRRGRSPAQDELTLTILVGDNSWDSELYKPHLGSSYFQSDGTWTSASLQVSLCANTS